MPVLNPNQFGDSSHGFGQRMDVFQSTTAPPQQQQSQGHGGAGAGLLSRAIGGGGEVAEAAALA